MARQLRRSWLDAYLDYMSSTENPTEFNLWSGVSAISSALKRRVFIWRNFVQFFPNQYIVLVGPPGIGKGSAIHPALAIVNAADAVNFLSDKITAEKIIARLADGFTKIVPSATGNLGTLNIQQDHTATIVSKELPVFLSSSEWMHALLCQLWDENTFEYETKNKGSYKIENMCVGLLAGCVPDFIRMLSTNTMAAITGGFTARTIFVYATEKSKLVSGGWGKPGVNLNKLKDELINDLTHITKLEGEFHFDPSAKALWDAKYAEHNKHDEFESDVTANFKSRLSSHIIKLSMTISIAECDTLMITASHLQRAMTMLEEVRDRVDIVFRSVGESPIAVGQERVRRYIFKRGLTDRSSILAATYKDVTDDQLTQIIYTPLHSGHIMEETQGSKILYKSLDSD